MNFSICFMGFSFCFFFLNFARIRAPLNALNSDSVPFVWTFDCEDDFLQLKTKLMSEPVLQFSDLLSSLLSRFVPAITPLEESYLRMAYMGSYIP